MRLILAAALYLVALPFAASALELKSDADLSNKCQPTTAYVLSTAKVGAQLSTRKYYASSFGS
jgi:hypothetical protein